VLMRHLVAGEHLALVAQPGRMAYLATVNGELVVGDQRLAVPERIILRSGEIGISSEAGASVVVVEVPLT
jgi:hypothetical protein